eukprot:TRINITY_DN13638_c0_g1_i1.p1 TRINITY_DN13638_c0_g1~~TRINITY_DN13638_c0_g1_i1.p1  ORF type:complete len:514 (+),score=64.64 TRINITY_DN13638_c0_g1_i1:100-1641(+)
MRQMMRALSVLPLFATQRHSAALSMTAPIAVTCASIFPLFASIVAASTGDGIMKAVGDNVAAADAAETCVLDGGQNGEKTGSSCGAQPTYGGDIDVGNHGLFGRIVSPHTGVVCDTDSEDDLALWGRVKARWFKAFQRDVLGRQWNRAFQQVVSSIERRKFRKLVSQFFTGEQGPIEKAMVKALHGVNSTKVQISTAIQKVKLWTHSPDDHVEVWGLPHAPYALLLSDWIQSSGVDEAVYHGSLVHFALLAHDGPESVFVGGGGEGLTLRDVLRHRSVKSAVMVDVDRELMELAQTRLGAYHRGSFWDTRAEVSAGDARAYLERNETQRLFDIIILDFNEFYYTHDENICLRLGGLFTREFYGAAKRRLRPGGILVTQMPSYEECAVITALSVQFKYVHLTAVPMVVYPLNVFAFASDNVDPTTFSAADIDARIASRLAAAPPVPDEPEATAIVKPAEWYSGAAHIALLDLDRRLRRTGVLPCESKCVMADMQDAEECTKEEDAEDHDDDYDY